MDTFSKMSDDNTIDFTASDSDQIYFFQQWFTSWILKVDITDMEYFIDCVTEK